MPASGLEKLKTTVALLATVGQAVVLVATSILAHASYPMKEYAGADTAAQARLTQAYQYCTSVKGLAVKPDDMPSILIKKVKSLIAKTKPQSVVTADSSAQSSSASGQAPTKKRVRRAVPSAD